MESNGLTVVALSGGKDSTAMALHLAETEPGPFTFVCTPTGNELPEMFAHWRKLRDLLPHGTFRAVCASTLEKNIRDNGMIPNWRARFCTRQLKIEPFAAFMAGLEGPVTSCVGIRADEPEREGGDYSDVPGVTRRFPLREWGWGIGEVMSYLEARGVTVPKRTDCALCFFQRLGEWWDLWRDYPEEYAKGEALEAEFDHTFRSDGRDTWPAKLSELRERFEAGHIPPGADVQGGLFESMRCRVCRI